MQLLQTPTSTQFTITHVDKRCGQGILLHFSSSVTQAYRSISNTVDSFASPLNIRYMLLHFLSEQWLGNEHFIQKRFDLRESFWQSPHATSQAAASSFETHGFYGMKNRGATSLSAVLSALHSPSPTEVTRTGSIPMMAVNAGKCTVRKDFLCCYALLSGSRGRNVHNMNISYSKWFTHSFYSPFTSCALLSCRKGIHNNSVKSQNTTGLRLSLFKTPYARTAGISTAYCPPAAKNR